MLNRRISDDVITARSAALAAGELLFAWVRDGDAEERKDRDHRAIVTRADFAAQDAILRMLRGSFPAASVLAEESARGHASTVIADEGLADLLTGRAFVVDPLDGTSMHRAGLYEWSVSVGVMREGMHVGGAIVAPAVNGGVLVYGERAKGCYRASVKDMVDASRCAVRQCAIADRVVYLGCDMLLLPSFARFVHECSARVRVVNVVGSCALGLAMVASGCVDALVQPVQAPWDWAAGYPLVEEAGGTVRFYHYRDGFVESLEAPDLPSYSRAERNTAFVAGSRETVEWLYDLLREYWARPVLST